MIRALALAATVVALAACGQKGPLKLPDPPPAKPADPSPAKPADPPPAKPAPSAP